MPIATRSGSATTRSRIRSPFSEAVADHPGSITVVPVSSTKTAGPKTGSPVFRAARATNGVS